MAGTGALKHTWSTSIKNDSGTAVVNEAAVVITGDDEVNFSESLPVAADKIEIPIAVTVAKIKSAYVTSSQAATIYTNSDTGAGGQVIELEANKSVAWHDGMESACPFTPDITTVFVKNNGAAVAVIKGGFLLSK